MHAQKREVSATCQNVQSSLVTIQTVAFDPLTWRFSPKIFMLKSTMSVGFTVHSTALCNAAFYARDCQSRVEEICKKK